MLLKTLLKSLVLLLFLSPQALNAQKGMSQFKDSLDGAVDISYWLASVHGFFPLVMPVTEPAVGYGAGGGLVFIHRDFEALQRGDPAPPSMSFLGGLYTQNGTWGIGGGHSGVWKNDRIRYVGAAFYASVNLTYYPSLIPQEFNFNLESLFFLQQIAFRLGKIKLFGGVRYLIAGTEASFDRVLDIPGVGPWEIQNTLAGAGPVLFLDYRDNTFTPNKGVFVKGSYAHYAPWLGGDVTYNTTSMYAIWYTQPLSWLVTGLRLEFQNSWGEIPFFAKPFVNLRGIPALRFQDYYTLTFETEERFDLTKRWALTAFGGLAKAFNPDHDFQDYDWVYNYGAGFRYKIARLLNLYSGMDFAWGPDSWGFYIVLGHAWNRL